MKKKPLTGWLILLIVILGPLTFGQVSGAIERINTSCEPLYAEYPSLLVAANTYKLLMCTSVCVSIYTAWVLYRRRPGSLGIAQAGLVIRAVFSIAANVSEPLLAGQPADVTKSVYNDLAVSSGIMVLHTGVWCYYLIRSKRVLEIYAA